MKKATLFVLILILALCMTITSFAAAVVSIPENAANQAPVELTAEDTLGQTFKAKDKFNKIALRAPTFGTKENSNFTFTIRKDGPTGKGLYSLDVKKAADNSTTITLPTLEAGTYYIEMSKPDADQIGWWTTTIDSYPDGAAYVNGEEDTESDRQVTITFTEGAKVSEGLKTITDEPAASQSAAATKASSPSASKAATSASPAKTQSNIILPSSSTKPDNKDNSPISPFIIGGLIVVIIAGGALTFFILKDKKK